MHAYPVFMKLTSYMPEIQPKPMNGARLSIVCARKGPRAFRDMMMVKNEDCVTDE